MAEITKLSLSPRGSSLIAGLPQINWAYKKQLISWHPIPTEQIVHVYVALLTTENNIVSWLLHITTATGELMLMITVLNIQFIKDEIIYQCLLSNIDQWVIRGFQQGYLCAGIF